MIASRVIAPSFRLSPTRRSLHSFVRLALVKLFVRFLCGHTACNYINVRGGRPVNHPWRDRSPTSIRRRGRFRENRLVRVSLFLRFLTIRSSTFFISAVDSFVWVRRERGRIEFIIDDDVGKSANRSFGVILLFFSHGFCEMTVKLLLASCRRFVPLFLRILLNGIARNVYYYSFIILLLLYYSFICN